MKRSITLVSLLTLALAVPAFAQRGPQFDRSEPSDRAAFGERQLRSEQSRRPQRLSDLDPLESRRFERAFRSPREQAQAQMEAYKPFQVSGRIEEVRPLTLRGEEQPHQIAKVRVDEGPQRGQTILLDLGPADQLQKQNVKLQSEVRIDATGVQGRINEIPTLIVSTFDTPQARNVKTGFQQQVAEKTSEVVAMNQGQRGRSDQRQRRPARFL
jgi:hypothetical protein